MFNRLWLFTQIVASNWNASMNAFSNCDKAKKGSKSINKHVHIPPLGSIRAQAFPVSLESIVICANPGDTDRISEFFGTLSSETWSLLVQQFVYYCYSCCCCFQWRCCCDCCCCCCCLLMLLKSVSDYLVVLLLLLLRLGYVEPSAHIGIKCNRIGYQHQLFMCDYVYFIYIYMYILCWSCCQIFEALISRACNSNTHKSLGIQSMQSWKQRTGTGTEIETDSADLVCERVQSTILGAVNEARA